MPSIPTPLSRSRWNSDADNVDIQYNYRQMDKPPGKGWLSGRKGYVIKILVLAVFFISGLIAGYLIRRGIHGDTDSHVILTNKYKDYDPKTGQKLRTFITAQSLKSNLRYLTSNVHLAGRNQNNLLAEYMSKAWINYGVDQARVHTYEVLLSYPNLLEPNHVSLLDNNGSLRYMCNSTGNLQHPELIAYNAYAPNATVQGDLVYANYGRKRDFDELENVYNVTVKDRIVIIRYGRGFRGDKIEEATKRGAKGVILFSDPQDYAQDPAKVWPNGWWIPGDAVQLGTIRHDGGGDPLTPNNPSTPGAYRLPVSNTYLPTIPVQPIGYDDAKQLLRYMAGHFVPKWKGNIAGVPYAIGPGFTADKLNWTVKLQVNNYVNKVNVTNVVGIIRGIEEPDRYVIVGNHRDAWNYGALDPSGGTAVLDELVKAFGALKMSTKWQPRRSIIFANWDAEEFGLIGSFEWMEEYEHDLVEKTVAYINMDSPLKGNYTFGARSSPMLKDIIYEATKLVPCTLSDCVENNLMVYDDWLKKTTRQGPNGNPKVGYLGAGSDHTSFLHEFGIPSMYPAYSYDRNKTWVPSPPFYHTKYDTFEMAATYMDPSFEAHHTYTDVVSEIILKLAESAKLELNTLYYIHILNDAFKRTQANYGKQLRENGVSLDYLRNAISLYSDAHNKFLAHFKSVDPSDVLELRRVNDILMRVSRVFITPRGLPGRPQIRNVLLAPSSRNWYAGSIFPGIEDAMLIQPIDWEIVKEQVSIMLLAVRSAADVLTGGIAGL